MLASQAVRTIENTSQTQLLTAPKRCATSYDEEEDDVNDKEGGEMGTTGLSSGMTKVKTRVMIKKKKLTFIPTITLADCSIGTGSIP